VKTYSDCRVQVESKDKEKAVLIEGVIVKRNRLPSRCQEGLPSRPTVRGIRLRRRVREMLRERHRTHTTTIIFIWVIVLIVLFSCIWRKNEMPDTKFAIPLESSSASSNSSSESDAESYPSPKEGGRPVLPQYQCRTLLTILSGTYSVPTLFAAAFHSLNVAGRW